MLLALLAAPLLAGCTGTPDEAGDPSPVTPAPTPTPTPTGPPAPPEPAPAVACRATPDVPATETGGRFNVTFEQGRGELVGDCALPVPPEGEHSTPWNATREKGAARSGEWGMNVSLQDARDGGAVWVERAVRTDDATARYPANLSFFVRADGDVEAIAFVGLRSPFRLEQFTPFPNGTSSIPGAQHARVAVPADGAWHEVRVAGPVTTSSEGVVFVALGFARAGPGPAFVHVDDVRFSLG